MCHHAQQLPTRSRFRCDARHRAGPEVEAVRVEHHFKLATGSKMLTSNAII